MALSTKPYKGARDFYPEDKRLQKYMFNKWREVAEKYGYEEYDAPVLEPLEIYLAKTGDEIVNEQTYAFEDRGGRKVVVRPEMTPTVSRMVASRRQELSYPLRWYSIPNLWRYERPQRGRLREHWQLNIDIFGVKDKTAEIEMILLVDDIFKSFGAKTTMYEIRINNRELIEYLLSEYLGLSEKAKYSISKLIDKKAKISKTDFISKVDQTITAKQREDGITEKLLSILEANSIKELPKEAQSKSFTVELAEVIAKLKSYGISNVKFDSSLMRGFDYYTGIVFEVFDLNPENNRSMLGGGRYDGLVGLFGVAPVPTVGLGWGDVTLINFLEGNNLLPNLPTETDVYIVSIGDIDVQQLSSQLRYAGINVAVDLSGKKIGGQIKTADKKGISRVIIVGEEEINSGKYKLKNLTTGDEKNLDIKGLIREIV